MNRCLSLINMGKGYLSFRAKPCASLGAGGHGDCAALKQEHNRELAGMGALSDVPLSQLSLHSYWEDNAVHCGPRVSLGKGQEV
jgi:hypothetical protein